MATRILATFLLATLLVGCNLTKEERRLNRGTKKLEKLVTKFPELKRTDTLYTIIPPKIIHGETLIRIDSARIDSLRQLLESCSDTVVNRVIEFIPSICHIDPVLIDNSYFKGRIWAESGKLYYDIGTKPDTAATVVETIQPVKVQPSSKSSNKWLWLFAGIGIGAFLVMIFKR